MKPHAPTSLAAPPAPDALRQALLADREQALRHLYQQTFPVVRRRVLRQGGTEQDAKDVFHDALIVFYEKAVAGTLVLTAAPSTYLVSVCRNLWLREQQRRTRGPLVGLPVEHEELAEPDASAPAEALSVLEYVEQMGDKCRSILLSFYYFQQPLEQIAAAHHYRSIRSATVQKFKCLERLRTSVRAAFAETFAS